MNPDKQKRLAALEALKSDAWDNYITKLPNSIPTPLQQYIRVMWNSVKSFAPTPTQAEPINNIEPSCFSFVWDKGHHHLDIDLWEDGYAEWFYRNRKTDEVDGTEFEPFHCAFMTDSDCPEGLRKAFKLVDTRPVEMAQLNWWDRLKRMVKGR